MASRAAPARILSTAQHARPNVIGHSEPVFDQLTSLSTDVVTKPSFRTPSIPIDASLPVESALLPFVDEADDEDREEQHHRPETGRADVAQRDVPREEER